MVGLGREYIRNYRKDIVYKFVIIKHGHNIFIELVFKIQFIVQQFMVIIGMV
jgi:hypothetical protein